MADRDIFDTEETNKRRDDITRKLIERQNSDIRRVLSSVEGRRFIWRVLQEAGIFRGSFTGNSETFFKEGKRDIGLFVLNDMLKAQPDSFGQMQRESATDKLLREADIQNAERGTTNG